MSSTQIPPVSRPARRLTPSVPPRSPEQSRFWLLCAAWALAILVFVAVSYRQFFTQAGAQLTDPDAMDFAQIARNMATGHGFATLIWRPLAVIGFAGPDAQGFAPDVSHAPLYPFLLMLVAMAHKGRISDNIVVLFSLVLFLCSVFAVYRLARILSPAPEQAGMALLATGLYAVSGEVLNYSLAGLPTALAVLMVTLLLIALHHAHEMPKTRATTGSALVVGLLLGLCYLTQYSLLLLAVPALVYIFFSRGPERSWAGVGACTLGFFLITGPWLIRNALISHGDPFFTLLSYSIMDTSDAYPGKTTIYRSVLPQTSSLVYFFTNLHDMPARIGHGLIYYRDNLLQAFNIFLFAGAAASLIWRSPDARLNALRGYAAFCLLAVVLVTSLFVPDVKSLAPFAPFIAVVAVGFLFSVITQQGWEPFLQKTAIYSLGLLICIGTLFQWAGTKANSLEISNGLQVLSSAGLQANQAVITDSPWAVAWRTGLPSIWLPSDNEAYDSLKAVASQKGISIRAILLTPTIAYYTDESDAMPWVQLSKNPFIYDQYKTAEQKIPGQAVEIKQKDANAANLTVEQVEQYLEQSLAKQMAPVDPINEVMADFQVASSVSETNGINSTVFLHR